MSISDPIADLLTRVRNCIMNHSQVVRVPFSKLKIQILEVLKREGFVRNFEIVSEENKKDIVIYLKYADNGASVITKLERISKPGCRIYNKASDVKPVLNGLGMSVITTAKGVLSDRECRSQNVGGEVICEIW
jgi:small subunit ribosomal protein S8